MSKEYTLIKTETKTEFMYFKFELMKELNLEFLNHKETWSNKLNKLFIEADKIPKELLKKHNAKIL